MVAPSPPPAAESSERPFQFGVKELLVVMLAIATISAIIAQIGKLGALAGLIAGWLLLAIAYKSLKAFEPLIIFCIICVLVVGFKLMPTGGDQQPNRSRACMNNLHQIQIALLYYEKDHQCYPPADIADANGKPMHSWRVLILPYLGRDDIYNAYDFNEPWNGPNNSKLAAFMPDEFQCPSDERAGPQMTSYVAVVGTNTVWPGGQSVRLRDIKDGAENTLLIVECANSGIHWMEPRDLHVAQMAPTVNAKHGQGICSKHSPGANAAMCEGYVQLLPESLSADQIRALLTIDGGEPTPEW